MFRPLLGDADADDDTVQGASSAAVVVYGAPPWGTLRFLTVVAASAHDIATWDVLRFKIS